MPIFPKHISQFIKKIERTHRGLGIPFLIQYIALVSKVSILWIGVKASGKSTIIESFTIPSVLLNDIVDISLYQVTKQKLAEKIGFVSNKTIVLRITELAQLSSYQKNLFINMVGTIITSHNFDYSLSKDTKIQIVNSDLIVSAGIQPITFSKMTLENTEWEQFATDRLLKLLLINPIRTTTIKQPPNIDSNLLFSKFYTGKLRKKKIDTTRLEQLFKKQLTIWRSKQYINDMLNAFTRILGLKTITQKTVNTLYTILYPYMHSFNSLNIRADLNSDKQIWGAGLELFSSLANYFGEKGLKGVTKRELANELDVSVRAVEKVLEKIRFLKETLNFDIIKTYTIREGRSFKTYVRLGDNIVDFFNNFYKHI